jgi:hypothetical protein
MDRVGHCLKALNISHMTVHDLCHRRHGSDHSVEIGLQKRNKNSPE